MRQVRELNKPCEVQRGFKVFKVSLWALKAYCRLQSHITEFRGVQSAKESIENSEHSRLSKEKVQHEHSQVKLSQPGLLGNWMLQAGHAYMHGTQVEWTWLQLHGGGELHLPHCTMSIISETDMEHVYGIQNLGSIWVVVVDYQTSVLHVFHNYLY